MGAVAGTGFWKGGMGNDLQRSVLSAWIITGPDLWQDTSQQLPTGTGTDIEFKDLWLTDMTFWNQYQTGTGTFHRYCA